MLGKGNRGTSGQFAQDGIFFLKTKWIGQVQNEQQKRKRVYIMKNSPTSKVQQGFKAKGLSFSTSDPNNFTVVKVGKNV